MDCTFLQYFEVTKIDLKLICNIKIYKNFSTIKQYYLFIMNLVKLSTWLKMSKYGICIRTLDSNDDLVLLMHGNSYFVHCLLETLNCRLCLVLSLSANCIKQGQIIYNGIDSQMIGLSLSNPSFFSVDKHYFEVTLVTKSKNSGATWTKIYGIRPVENRCIGLKTGVNPPKLRFPIFAVFDNKLMHLP